MHGDKLRELQRYDTSANANLSRYAVAEADKFGSDAIPYYLRTPYLFYENSVAKLIGFPDSVLELGAGTGSHTWSLVKTGALVTATDISPNALSLLKLRIDNAGESVMTHVADMELLPFEDASFDVVACAGSLSYGEPERVNSEIKRVLRPDGTLICVDSLNHNPIYRANRWLHFMRGNRSKSTLKRVPDLARIRSLSQGFSSVDVRFFGAMSYAMPGISRLFGENTARAVSDRIDQLVGVRHSAFKFVLVAQGFA